MLTHTTADTTTRVNTDVIKASERERNERRDQRQALNRNFATTASLYRRVTISRGKRILL